MNEFRTAVRFALEDEGWKVLKLRLANKPRRIQLNEPRCRSCRHWLPGVDGFEVCRSLRRVGDVPIIMVTARMTPTTWWLAWKQALTIT